MKRWLHLGGRRVSERNCHLTSVGSSYVSCCRNVGYGRRLGNILANIRDMVEASSSFVWHNVVAMSRPWEQLHSIEKWAYWASEMLMHSTGLFNFLGRHNIEAIALAPQQKADFNVSRPLWWPPYMFSRLLSVTSYPVFAYYSSFIVDSKLGAPGLWHFAITEYCMLVIMRFSSLCLTVHLGPNVLIIIFFLRFVVSLFRFQPFFELVIAITVSITSGTDRL